MDAMVDPAVTKVVVQKGSQIGWTAIIGNALGYFVHQDPASILIIQPTVEMAEGWSKERLDPMIRDTPVLTELFPPAKSRNADNTRKMKRFPGGYVAIIGANSPSALASRPIRIVLADETDRYPVSAGQGDKAEGDPLKLAEKRQTTFWNRKTLIGSTPTLKTISPIEREFKASDMRRFYVPCPHCGVFQDLRWEQVKWDKEGEGDDRKHLPDSAYYMGECCGVLWTDRDRHAAIGKGEWRATAPFAGVAGFHLSQLYSPWVKLSEVVEEFLDAQGRPELLRVWTNTVLGETWEEQGEQADAAGLRGHLEPYGPHDLPNDIRFLTAGVDTQGDRLEVEVVGWGPGEESWGVGHYVLPGDPAGHEIWDDLDDLLKWSFTTEGGRDLYIQAACIDAGGHHGDQVYKFCQGKLRRRIHAIRGVDGPRPIWTAKTSRTKNNYRVHMIGVDTAKDSLYGRFKIAEPGPGYCHFSSASSDEYGPAYPDNWFDQATVEKVVTRFRNGRPYRKWICPDGARNEALDCRVYALTAMKSLSPRHLKGPARQKPPAGVKTVPARQTDANEPDTEPARPQPVVADQQQRSRRSKRGGGGFLGGRRKGWL